MLTGSPSHLESPASAQSDEKYGSFEPRWSKQQLLTSTIVRGLIDPRMVACVYEGASFGGQKHSTSPRRPRAFAGGACGGCWYRSNLRESLGARARESVGSRPRKARNRVESIYSRIVCCTCARGGAATPPQSRPPTEALTRAQGSSRLASAEFLAQGATLQLIQSRDILASGYGLPGRDGAT